MKQFTTVYHIDLGKGHVVTTQYRLRNSLVMCYFPKTREHEFITEKELRAGTGDITLHKVSKSDRSSQLSIEDAISNLIGSMGVT